MKKLASLILFLLPLFIIAQEGFTVKAKFDQLGNNKVKASYYKNGKNIYDTLVANKKGVVLWEGRVDEPQIVRAPASEDSVAPAPAKSPPRSKTRKR